MLDAKNLKYNSKIFTYSGDINIGECVAYIFNSMNYKTLPLNYSSIKQFELLELLKKDLTEIDLISWGGFSFNNRDFSYYKDRYFFTNANNSLIIAVYTYDERYLVGLRDYNKIILYYLKESIEISSWEKKLDSYIYRKIIDKIPKFNVIICSNNGFSVKTFNNDDININEYYYNSDLDLNKVKNILTSDKSGLLLFSGVPGSGKSSLIKYLSKELDDKEFYYITPEIISMFNSPEALSFLMDTLKDSVLVLEDCENLLLSRKVNKGNGITTILNLTDGIIGNALKLKIIATINTSDKIDEALLRKSRTLYSYDFKLLTPERANKCAEVLGIKEHFSQPIALTDIFNYYEDNGTTIQSNKIGF